MIESLEKRNERQTDWMYIYPECLSYSLRFHDIRSSSYSKSNI